jgi:copper transport protein
VRLAALGFALMALVLPAEAFAHATLKQTTPEIQSRVETAPRLIRLRFDQSVGITPRAIEVFTQSGQKVSATSVASGNDMFVTARLQHLQRGAYTVRWRVTSSDGHTGSGVFTFGVRVAAPPPTQAYGSTGPSWKDDLIRWALFVSLALVIGVLSLRVLVLRGPLSSRVRNRIYLLAGIGAVATINVGIVGFIVRAANALQLPFGDLLYGDLSPFATKTRFGEAFVAMTLGFALVSGLLALGWIFDRDQLLVPALVVAVCFASGLSLSGHGATEPNSTWLSQTADFLHLIGACIWVGGLVTLVACVWPLAPELRRSAFLGFSRVATLCVAVLVLAGTYLSIERLPALSDLWTTSYGQTLLVKLGLVSVALLFGAVHNFIVRPRLERGEDAPRGLRRSLIGESTLALVVLVVAAVLVNSAPPPAENGSAPTRASAQ